jgi:hypothetical protein
MAEKGGNREMKYIQGELIKDPFLSYRIAIYGFGIPINFFIIFMIIITQNIISFGLLLLNLVTLILAYVSWDKAIIKFKFNDNEIILQNPKKNTTIKWNNLKGVAIHKQSGYVSLNEIDFGAFEFYTTEKIQNKFLLFISKIKPNIEFKMVLE